jgi:DNA polymerase delta subunit 1
VYDGRQLALKITANSVYGFTGARIGKLPCLEISASVTARGRQMINEVKDVTEREFSIKNGKAFDTEIIYGDTDSVMIKGPRSLAEAMVFGKESAKFATAKLKEKFHLDYIDLTFEKVYYPYLLLSKKRYAGLYWTKEDKYDKVDAKGIESVRRDNCLLVSRLVAKCIEFFLVHKDVEGAKEYVRKTAADLVADKVDISLLIITKSFNKSTEEYKSMQVHTALVEKMKERDPLTAPTIGSRVPYVIVKGTKNAKTYQKSEDPMYAIENGIPLDFDYYINNQLLKPVTRIFSAVMDNPESLLKGEHMKYRVINTPKTGGIVGFTVKLATCLKCRVRLSDQKAHLCAKCKEDEATIYQDFVEKLRDTEKKFTELWTQCQTCQGSMHQQVICDNRDCPIFYARKKAASDAKKASEIVDKFSIEW